MLDPTACRFWQVALQSGLMDPEGLRACWDALPPEKRTPEAIDRRLARQAIQQNRLTLWQAQQLLAGRSTGFKIDRYTLVNMIGQGGMGRVYLARDTRLNRYVAVKILSPERVNNPRAIARFHREAMLGAQLQHENLVRIYDEGEANGRCYLVMEFIEGKTIGAMIAEGGPLPPSLAARLARQVALGLEHAQRKGLIHRDVNPYNILVTREGVAKLTDLGLALDLADTERYTRDGATVGTFDYVSPEQARNSHDVDTRSDIYSLGCTLYHMLSGRVPFPSASLPEKLLKHQGVDPEPLTRPDSFVPPGLGLVVSRMMRKKPDDRYATPLEVAQALEPFTEDYGPLGHDITPPIDVLTAAAAALAPPADMPSATTASVLGIEQTNVSGVPANGPPAAAPATPVAVASTPAPARNGAGTVPKKVAAPPAPERHPVEPKPSEPIPDEPAVLNLPVDLGPEPSLTEGLANRGKSRSKSESPETKDTLAEPGPGLPRWLTASLAAVVLFGVLGVLLGLSGTFRGGGGQSPEDPRTKTAAASTKGGRTSPEVARGKEAPKRKTLEVTGSQVAVEFPDGTRSVEPDLRSALRTVSGGRGQVILLNSTPISFEAKDALLVGGGRVTIRAGQGVCPVLRVTVGILPFLGTKADSPLVVEGVTFEVRYVNAGASPPAVISGGSHVTLNRCSFRLEGPPVPGSRAVEVQGSDLSLHGCWFENFARGLDLGLFAGSTIRAEHCVFLNRPNETGEGGTWAVRLVAMPGGAGRGGRRLEFNRCTAVGTGVLSAVGFTAAAPLKIDMQGCALFARQLLNWEAPPPERHTAAKSSKKPGEAPDPPDRDALSWFGEGNQYEIQGKSWITLSPTGGQPGPWTEGPGDLTAWCKVLGAERDPILQPFKFATDPNALPEHPAPSDFALTDPDGKHATGADPIQVGPSPTRGRTSPAGRKS